MEAWRRVFREGVVPQLSIAGLQALKAALEHDDSRLIQGAACSPPPLQCVADWPVEAACAVSFTGWQGDGLRTVAEVEDYFARTCYTVDLRLGKPAGIRYFLNEYDQWDRATMIANLLPEVEAELALRGVVTAKPSSPLAKLLSRAIDQVNGNGGGA